MSAKDKESQPKTNASQAEKSKKCIFGQHKKNLAAGFVAGLAVGITSGYFTFGSIDQSQSVHQSIANIESKLAALGSPSLDDGNANAVNQAFKPTQALSNNLRSLGVEFVDTLELSKDRAIAGLAAITAKMPDGQVMPLFTSLDGQYLIPAIIDMQTRADVVQEIAMEYLTASGSAPDRLDHAKDWDRLADSNYIAMGSNNPTRIVYITHDPFCPHCNALWLDKEKVGIPEGTQIVSALKSAPL